MTFCAYFTFGFFYLRLVRGAKGIEQIPNREFWFTVGNKLAVSIEMLIYVCHEQVIWCICAKYDPGLCSSYLMF